MKLASALFALGLGSAACHPALAQDASSFIGAPDCRYAPVDPAPAQTPAWDGACKAGYADGKGTLSWRDGAGKTYKLEASLAAGQVQGEAKLRFPDGSVYIGTLRDGVPDGKGYFSDRNGNQYEGDVRMGERTGSGEAHYHNGNRYKGSFRNGKRDGTGFMTYALGGSYEGGWKDDQRSGPGKLVYAGGTGREAAVVDGRLPGAAETPDAERLYTLKSDYPGTGTMLRDNVATRIPVPPTLGYDKLSAQEQAVVKGWYAALAPGDEPPYPKYGPASFYKTVQQISSRLRQKGDVFVLVLVGKDGKALSVKTIGLEEPEARKVIAIAAGILEYKPARCAGQPCEMGYGYSLKLTLDN